MTRRAYILSAFRTPVAPKGGAYQALNVDDLAAPVLQRCLSNAGLTPDHVDEVIIGNALYGGGNPARRILLAAGLPERIAGLTIDSQCCSGLDAILQARNMIASGQADCVLAGGVESSSQQPIRLRPDPNGGPAIAYDQPPFTPWPDRDPLMHDAAARLARDFGISKQAQNDWAISSHAKAMQAASKLAHEYVHPIGATLKNDAFTRNLTQRHCERAKSIAGSVTIATAAVSADAAALVLVASEKYAQSLAGPGMEIVAGSTLGGDPELPGLAPIAAVKHVLDSVDVKATELTHAEIMEAYAVQAMICSEKCGIDPKIANRGGGALARGHPIGASGAILAVRLFSELHQIPGYGLAAIAAAGGLGSALLVKSTELGEFIQS